MNTNTPHHNATPRSSETPIRILVSGIGGVGGYYAGKLAHYIQNHPEEQVEVYFHMRRGKHFDQVASSGLVVENPFETIVAHPFRVVSDADTLPKMDYVILATKSYQLTDSLASLSSVLQSGTVVLPLLNGLDVHDRLQEVLPPNVVRWVGVVFITARRTEPGRIVSHSQKERLFMGNPCRAVGELHTEKENFLENLLQKAGISAIVPNDPMHQVRKKFMMLSNSAAATAYWDTDVDGLVGKYREFTIGLTQELIALYEARSWQVEDDAIEAALYRIAQMPSGTTTSMHSDLKAGNPSELSSLVEYVVRESNRLGLATPYYTEALEGIKQKLEQGYYKG